MEDEVPANRKKWRQRLIGAIGAMLIGIPATLIGVAFSAHQDRLADFEDAQDQCKRSLSAAAVEAAQAADVAHRHAMEEPQNDGPTSLWNSLNASSIDCHHPLLKWRPEQDRFGARAFMVQSAWLFRNRKYPGADETIEEGSYRQTSDDFAAQANEATNLPLPSLRDSFRDLIPF